MYEEEMEEVGTAVSWFGGDTVEGLDGGETSVIKSDGWVVLPVDSPGKRTHLD